MQFEWAYQLQKVVRPSFVVLCEHRVTDANLVAPAASGIRRPLVDVSLVKSPAADPVWEGLPHAGIELKWWGNWWVNKISIASLEADLRKVEAYSFPAATVLLFLHVGPIDSDPLPSDRFAARIRFLQSTRCTPALTGMTCANGACDPRGLRSWRVASVSQRGSFESAHDAPPFKAPAYFVGLFRHSPREIRLRPHQHRGPDDGLAACCAETRPVFPHLRSSKFSGESQPAKRCQLSAFDCGLPCERPHRAS